MLKGSVLSWLRFKVDSLPDHMQFKAHHLQPADLSILYNIAMIQQKSAEMLFAIPSQKRTLKELKEAIDGAGAGQL